MFDIAFSELVVIAIVALIVIGPERLPKVARTIGTVVGRMQRYMTQIKDEVNRESRFAELQKLQQEIQQATDSAQSGFQGGANYLADTVGADNQNTIQEVDDTAASAIKPQESHSPIKD
ncbi:MAG: Sec-independent protein translocase protein TatB [Methylotenera sp.]|jgi:sec-independent protein translocase protein TatB|uniref:Sec-independent protein translocase protein TatB n=1 Tax=Methylotenera sp. TaxID=2051956 RepID=UPI002723F815|nr:Sec-independent protein translocase protein TatB [Methylotenera sp.]MDO9150319.1 Sec-independent protein translocase protein TatB [Methylotenera sp.]